MYIQAKGQLYLFWWIEYFHKLDAICFLGMLKFASVAELLSFKVTNQGVDYVAFKLARLNVFLNKSIL